MRRKLAVALAVAALALSGAREASEQFHQLRSLAGGWADTNTWNSLLVYAAGTFDGLAPQRQTALVASHTAASGDAKAARAPRAIKQARRPARVKVESAEPVIAELAFSHAEDASRLSAVEEFRIEVARDAAKAALIVPRFSAADFETEVARVDGGAPAELGLGLPKLFGRDFVFKLTQAEALKGRRPVKRVAARRTVEERRAADADDDATDAEAQEVLFDAPSDAGLLNCDEEPRR